MARSPKRLIDNPPPGLRERPRADGTVRVWWEPPAEARAKGKKPVELDATRLTWSVRKANELNKALTKPAPKATVGRTINFLTDDYESSLAFKKKAAATQRSYRRFFSMIRAKWGKHLIADFNKPTMRTWYETLYEAKSPYMAMHLIRHMSILFSHAERRGWRPEGSNPCTKVGIEVPKGRRRTAGWAEFDALIAAADRLGHHAMGDAIALSMLSGQRSTDIRTARREHFQAIDAPEGSQAEGEAPAKVWVWIFERSKRGNAAFAVLHPEAVARLAERLARVAAGPLFLDDKTGEPFKEDLFGHRFADVRAAAVKAGFPDLADLQFRDLRRTFGRLSRRGGATKSDVADVLGNSAATNQFLADVYMSPEIETAIRAVGAIERPQEPERKRA